MRSARRAARKTAKHVKLWGCKTGINNVLFRVPGINAWMIRNNIPVYASGFCACNGCGEPFRRMTTAGQPVSYCSTYCKRKHGRRKNRAVRQAAERAAREERQAAERAAEEERTQHMLASIRELAQNSSGAPLQLSDLKKYLEPQLDGKSSCPNPRKFIYHTRSDAEARREQSWAGEENMHSYYCICGYWHLGHQPKLSSENVA